MADTVWATGFWPDGFWADGFWAGGDSPPSPTPVESNSGGWAAFIRYEQERDRRRRKRREEEEAEDAIQALPDPVDREIAELLHKQERQDARRAELERLRTLVAEHAGSEGLSPRVASAIDRVRAKQTVSSLMNLERELRRMMEEEEQVILMLLLDG